MKKGIVLILFMLGVLVFCGLIYRKLYLGTNDPETNAQTEMLDSNSTGENVKHLQRKINDLIKESMHSNFPLMDGDTSKSYHWITDTINVSGMFDQETQNALHAITGKKSIATSEIDSLKLPMQK
ncbi:MAG TPA: hypothetical protein PKM40_03945 [Bacteroidia bacterium]|jgi:hypothetical protein|nr:hypothetical protein [Bacteroidia bacterium]